MITICCWGGAVAPTLEGVEYQIIEAPHDLDPLAALALAFEEHEGDVVLFGGEYWPDYALDRLRRADPSADAVTAADTRIEGLNPFTENVSEPIERVDALINAVGYGRTWRVRHVSTALSLWRSPPGPDAKLSGCSIQLGMQSGVLVPVAAAVSPVAQNSGVCHILDPFRVQVTSALEDPLPQLPFIGHDPKGICLHVLHDWGGGVAQWVRDVAEHLDDRLHLFFVSHGDDIGLDCGRRVALYAQAPGSVQLDHWQLPLSMVSLADADVSYESALKSVVERYGIQQLIVSSLIGHSLDALRTGLPTLVALHDYFPAWPLLEVCFEADDRPFTAERLEDDRSRMGPKARLSTIDSVRWKEIVDAWMNCVRAPNIAICAPSQSLVSNLARVDSRFAKLDIAVIPLATHEITSEPVYRAPETRPDRWTIVIPGRINRPKGKALLLSIAEELGAKADVFLLGAGEDGHAFFGRNGFHVLIDYDRNELAGILRGIKPDFSLLLSTVSETFGYTLSEMWNCGIPVIANQVGAFAERITDNVGRTVKPEGAAILSAIEELNVDDLQRWSSEIKRISLADFDAMSAAYAGILPPPAAAPTPSGASTSDMQSAAWAHRVLTLTQSVKKLTSTVAQQKEELAERADWGYDLGRRLEKRTQWAKSLEQDLTQARDDLAGVQADLEERTEWAHSLTKDLESVREQCATLHQMLDERWQQIGQLEADLDQRSQQLASASRAYEERTEEYLQVVNSRSWYLTKPLRFAARTARRALDFAQRKQARVKTLSGRTKNSLKVRGVSGTAARIARELRPRKPPVTTTQAPVLHEEFEPVRFDKPKSPLVSVIIPVHNHYEHTYTCLQSLIETKSDAVFEVIVVDDASTDVTVSELPRSQGMNVLVNKKNLGFIGTCNRGAKAARGEYVVFLNNDTAVSDHWLDHLLKTFAEFPDAGLVGAKLVYPDGRLQEAGGIIFSDGSGWNYGRFEDPDHPSYNYVREADYCSGAAICIRRAFFEELGGFDTRYAPAYYEDTDLAFAVRKAGKRVYYQPKAVVTHFEGVTSGTDTSSGVKQYQVVNQQKFLEKWKVELAHQRPPDGELLRAREHGRSKLALIVDACTPEPDKDSGSVRMVHLMEILRQEGYQVAFLADNRAWVDTYSENLQQMGVEVFFHPHADGQSRPFKDLGISLDVAMVSRHYVATHYVEPLRRYCPKAKILFDTVDLHYLREERLAALEGDADLAKTAAQTRKDELGVAARSDVTVVVSGHEKEVLAKEVPELKVAVISNIHRVHGRRTEFEDRENIMFVGGYQHPPNIDSVHWFCEEIFPRVREQLPNVVFHIIGSKAPASVRKLGKLPGVRFEGFVPSMEPWLDGCRLSVAPLRYGAGVKGKVNSSMSYGQPVVASPPAVEGMFAKDREDVLVADSAEDFADRVVEAYTDRDLWYRLSDGGIRNVENHFSFDAARKALIGALRLASGQES